MSKRKFLFSTTALTPLLIVMGTSGAFAQAVSYPNQTLGGFGGIWQGSTFGSTEGRWTMPLDLNRGAQLDALTGVAGGQFFGQLAGHGFGRDPNTGLFGVYGAWNQAFGVTSYRIGPEFEAYLGNFTVSGVGGVRTGAGTETFSDFFTQLKGSIYVTPNTKLFGGYIYEGGSWWNAGFEQLFQGGLSAFGEVRGGQGSTVAWGGLRYYFGAPGVDKSLIDRERQDIAPLWIHIADKSAHVPAPGGT